MDALDAAKYLLTLADEDAGDLISNLKLQKLLYYAQGIHLALYDEPMFEDSIEAWTYGPAVPEVWRAFRHCERGAIPRPEDFDPMSIPPRIRETLDEVYRVYGQFSAWALRDLTHEEPPWRDATQGQVIENDALREFFLTRVTGN